MGLAVKAIRVLFCFAILISGAAMGQTTIGVPDCGKWVNSHTPSQEGWLYGFLSGINIALSRENHDPLGQTKSGDQIKIWMDNYCRANPLSDVVVGAFLLFNELQLKAVAASKQKK